MKELAWLRRNPDAPLELYVRDSGTNGQWVHYTAHRLSVGDYQIPGGSRGFATMQKLLRMDYKFAASGGVVDAVATCDGTCGVKTQ